MDAIVINDVSKAVDFGLYERNLLMRCVKVFVTEYVEDGPEMFNMFLQQIREDKDIIDVYVDKTTNLMLK